MNLYIYGQLIFDKGAKIIQWRSNNLLNKWCWFIHMQKSEAGSLPQAIKTQ